MGKAKNNRLPGNSGIAIGPILFIIAILGILAAGIAAGSGAFSTSTTGESNRTKAAALIDIGQNLKLGMDRILGNGVALSDVDLDPTHTTDADDLFSPIGGGISPPSKTMAYSSSVTGWIYRPIIMPGIGTTAGSTVAMLIVSAGVCDEINNKANGIAITGTPGETAYVDTGFLRLFYTQLDLYDATVPGRWPAALYGKPTGCVRGGCHGGCGLSTGNYYFSYQVIAIQ